MQEWVFDEDVLLPGASKLEAGVFYASVLPDGRWSVLEYTDNDGDTFLHARGCSAGVEQAKKEAAQALSNLTTKEPTMKKFYIYLDYENGLVVPDSKILDFIRNYEYKVLVVGSYMMLLAARVLHKRGEIVISLLRDEEGRGYLLDKNARCEDAHFDSLLDELLEELL